MLLSVWRWRGARSEGRARRPLQRRAARHTQLLPPASRAGNVAVRGLLCKPPGNSHTIYNVFTPATQPAVRKSLGAGCVSQCSAGLGLWQQFFTARRSAGHGDMAGFVETVETLQKDNIAKCSFHTLCSLNSTQLDS